MIRGLYTAASGLTAQQQKLDITSNNLANVATNGFKKDTTANSSFFESLIERQDHTEQSSVKRQVYVGKLDQGTTIEEVLPYLGAGFLQQTQTDSDLAIDGEGFFSIQDPGGSLYYTRDGAFKLDNDGYLATVSGDKVLGENGPLQLVEKGFKVLEDGSVVAASGTLVDKLLIVNLDRKNLKRTGQINFVALDGTKPAAVVKPELRQGYLESSNVNTADEMVNLIEVHRLYQVNQRLLRAEDEMLEKAVSQIGVVK